jgi:hypothetical protein
MNEAASQVAKLPSELRKLADAACNGTLTDAQRKRLEELLGHSKASQLAYLSYLDIHAQLQWEGRCGAQPERDAIPGDLEQRATSSCEMEHRATLLAAADPRDTGGRRRWWVAAVTAAALLVAVLGFVLYQFRPETRPPRVVPVATWVRGLDTQWEDARLGAATAVPAAGDPLRAGDYRLTRGWAEIRFASGAVVTLEAPVRIQLLYDGLARLNSGRLVAEVPPQAAGFMIQTPVGDVVDRGTGFGVEVNESGDAFLQVYDGQVAAEWIDRDADDTDRFTAPRRIWPLTALHFPAGDSSNPQQTPFEPLRFVRKLPEPPATDPTTVTSARGALDDHPDATAHVRAFLAAVETAPAEVMHVGRVYEDFSEINDFTTAELRVLIPALLDLLDDERSLTPGAAASRPWLHRRVADRAESVLEFAAGFRPEGQPRRQVWRDWWSSAQSETRAAWFADRADLVRERFLAWRMGAGYPENLHALNLVEIAVRSRDHQAVPILMELLRAEMPAAHKTEIPLAAFVDAVGRLGGPKLVPELADLARRLNDEQNAVEPEEYSDDHARRSSTLRSFATALDRLAGTELAVEAVRVIGPAELKMCALDEDAFVEWLKAAKLRAGAPEPGSPSDLPKGSAAPPTTSP